MIDDTGSNKSGRVWSKSIRIHACVRRSVAAMLCVFAPNRHVVLPSDAISVVCILALHTHKDSDYNTCGAEKKTRVS